MRTFVSSIADFDECAKKSCTATPELAQKTPDAPTKINARVLLKVFTDLKKFSVKEVVIMNNLTEIVFILDRSGSMAGLESDTIGGFNAMLTKQQSEVEGDALVSTILFNHKSSVLHDRVPLAEVKPLTKDDYQVGGNTALLDAVGDAVKHIRNIHKYAREEDRPQKTLVIITTDGYENSSRRFSYADIKKLIEQQKEVGWEFIFLGANIDAPEVAEELGIDRDSAVDYHADEIGTEKAFRAMSKRISYARSDSMEMPSFSRRAWREELDEDYNSRK